MENFEGAHIDRNNPIKIEVITEKELTKAACCDLAGCFETQMSVESKTTNIITNTKELSILGLSGLYNQILIDGAPLMYGLNYTYGISSIPGTLIKKIYISQGLASVLQGHESITGQINILLKDYDAKETVFLNRYYNSFGVKQLNVNYNFNLGKWKSIASIHATQPGFRIDKNNDDFLDMPLTTKYSFYNRWTYSQNDSKIYSTTTFRYLNEQHVGGQENFAPMKHKGGSDVYGQVIDFYQPEIYNKSSYKINSNNNILLEAAFSYHNQESYFGIKKYLATQKTYHTTLSHILNWKDHQLTSGFNFKKLKLEEEITSNITDSITGFSKNTKTPGLFAENHFKWNSGNTEMITGVRVDHHNKRIFLTPRMLIKHNLNENTFLRVSAGSGWRTLNVFSENIKLLACNRSIEISSDLQPEKAFNYGINILHAIYTDKAEFQIIIDFYKTIFSNQISPDYYRGDDATIYIDNFTGKSNSNSFQTEIGMELFKSLGIKIAYNYLDVFKMEDAEKHVLPFNSKHHMLGTISYQPIGKNWQFDMNTHWFGKKKLIYNEDNQITQTVSYSAPYSLLNVQFTKKMNKIDIYMGIENILSFKQDNPIIEPENPFGDNFDAANGVWGPTKGIEAYLGIKFRI